MQNGAFKNCDTLF